MTDLIEGAVYQCANEGGVRRLDKIEDAYLHYSVLIGDKNPSIWMKLTRTYRSQVERDFVEGQIIEDPVKKGSKDE